MTWRPIVRSLTAAVLAMIGSAVVAERPQLAALSSVSRGEWQFHEIGTAAKPREVCVSDVCLLLQLEHAGAQCSRFVLADGAKQAVVHYTCPGAGHGRTTIKVERASLIRLQTQGIAAGAPFDMDLEGRRIGNCA